MTVRRHGLAGVESMAPAIRCPMTASCLTWGAVAGLMVMHIVVVAVAVPAYRLLLPLPGGGDLDRA